MVLAQGTWHYISPFMEYSSERLSRTHRDTASKTSRVFRSEVTELPLKPSVCNEEVVAMDPEKKLIC